MEERTTLKHYRLLDRIGEGGMGVVYRAEDTRLGRTVALKMLHGSVAADEERSRRFEREARIVSAMNHPGIATLYDFDREGDESDSGYKVLATGAYLYIAGSSRTDAADSAFTIRCVRAR